MTHNNATGGVTDSAASATAMATGVKVNNGVISLRLPGDGSSFARCSRSTATAARAPARHRVSRD